jgi:hypothetical protein
MAIDIKTLISFFSSIRDILNDKKKDDLEKNERLKKALKCVMNATNKTHSYLFKLRKQAKTSEEKRTEIVEMWTEAAVQIMEFDSDLAKICTQLGKKWTDPTKWTARDIYNAERSLKVIEHRINSLLDTHDRHKKKTQPKKRKPPTTKALAPA